MLYLPTYRNGVLQATSGFLNGRSESQYGYRTNNLSPAEREQVESGRTWKDTFTLIDYYNDVGYEYTGHNDQPWMVHDRTYQRITYAPAAFQYAVTRRRDSPPYSESYDVTGCWGFSKRRVVLPTAPSDSVCSTLAANLMRQSVPNTRSFNLFRAIAEQRDAPRLAKGLSLKGLSPGAFHNSMRAQGLSGGLTSGKRYGKKAAELYLSWVFGLKPTLNDLVSAADAVVGLHHAVVNYLDLDKVRTRSSRGIELERVVDTDTLVSVNSNAGMFKSLTWKGAQVNCNLLFPSTDYEVTLFWSTVARRTLTQFANWEFFIPRPIDTGSRLNSYNEAAQGLIGEGASAATVYDLAPWTWLVDWFVDIGGVLHYQQALADNQVAALGNGWSLYDSTETTCVVRSIRAKTPGFYLSRNFYPGSYCSVSEVNHKRRSGNPYNMSPTWDLSTQQSAILGALGISRGR